MICVRTTRSFGMGLLLLLLLAGLPRAASAVPAFPDLLTIEQVGAGTMTLSSDDLACASTGAVTWQCNGLSSVFIPANPSFEWELSSWMMSLDRDPSVSQQFGFVNNASTTQTFVITTTLPVTVFGPASLVGGSMGGSVTDANGNGLGGLSTATGTPLYEGLVDGATALSIYPDPTSFTFVFAGQTVTIPAQNPGLPGPTLPGPALTATIGIRNAFTLSPGDSVAMTNFFEVVPVPEPHTALLLGLGLAGLALRRKS